VLFRSASNWQIDSSKIGVIGFSAGGHLASLLGTKYSAKVYDKIDEMDDLDPRPNFMILCYPVISMKDEITHKDSRASFLGANPTQEQINDFSTEMLVNSRTPQSFIVQADDDNLSTENSIRFYQALKRSGVNAEVHIFKVGGHGFGIRKASGPVAMWTKLCEEWLVYSDYINK
jgi:acetyl esterase/lipase